MPQTTQFADTPLGEEGQTTAQIAAANPGLGSFTLEALQSFMKQRGFQINALGKDALIEK